MRPRFLAPLLAALLLAAPLAVPAQAAPAFTPEQEEEIGRLVRDYLMRHPEVILEAVQELERRNQAAAQDQRGAAVERNWEALAEDPDSPVVGNPDGDVLMVEFFDYNCGYCRRMTPEVFALVESDGGIRYVLKELPIFGEGSRFAAKAALAADRQGRYADLHLALMAHEGQIDRAATLAIAADVGLDMSQLQRDLLDPALDAALERNYVLARALQVEGTPALVVGKTFVPGARPYGELEALVAQARAAAR